MQRFLQVVTMSMVAAAFAVPTAAQRGTLAPRAMTAADYARAETFMSWNTTPLVYRSGVRPTWLLASSRRLTRVEARDAVEGVARRRP